MALRRCDVEILDADRQVVSVPVGTTVVFRGLGLAIFVAFNSPDFRSQPLVVICTAEIPPRFAGGDAGPDIAVHLNDSTIFDGEPPPAAVPRPPACAWRPPACAWRRRGRR